MLPHSSLVLTCYLLNSFCLTWSRAQYESYVDICMLWKGYPVSSLMHVYARASTQANRVYPLNPLCVCTFEPLLSASMTVNLQLCDCRHHTCRPADFATVSEMLGSCQLCVILIRKPWESIFLTCPSPQSLILMLWRMIRCDFEGYLFYGRAPAAGPPPSLSGKDGTRLVHRRVGSCWTVARQNRPPREQKRLQLSFR